MNQNFSGTLICYSNIERYVAIMYIYAINYPGCEYAIRLGDIFQGHWVYSLVEPREYDYSKPH